MDEERRGTEADSWRVVVITVVGGAVVSVYRDVDAVLRPLGHRVVGVVTAAGPPRRRSLGYRDVVADVPPDVDVLVSNHPARWAAMLAPLRPDLIICGGMPWRIPAEVLALPRLGAINIHPSLLPRHRGPWPFYWTFRRGDAETGFTIHRIAPEFDAGPILAQGRVLLADEDDFGSLLGKMLPLVAGLLGTALARVARGDPGDPQDEARATSAGMVADEERIIDWTQPARSVHNQVRAWMGGVPEPAGALGEVEGARVRITKTRLLPAEPTGGAAPGTVLRRDGDVIVVACGDEALALAAWRRDEPVAEPAPAA